MKIRTSLTLKNILATATVLLLIFVIISVLSAHTRSNAFFKDLKGEALTKAHLFLQNQVDAKTMQDIYVNNRQFINEVEVAVYSPDFDMLYHDAVNNDIIKEDRQMIDHILQQRQIEFYIDDYQCVGMVYNYGGVDYVVTAAAYDGAGYANNQELQRYLVVLFFVSLTLLAVVGYLLARSSLRPIRKITREAEHITATDIDRRLPVENPTDELGELSSTFNALLCRLERSFDAQKQFVSNVSHELRTPLAAVIAQLDLSLQRQRTVDQYRADIEAALADARSMRSLIDGLLNLAKADYQRDKIKMEHVRLDELLLDVRHRLLTAHPDYHINLIFDVDADGSADDSVISVCANIYLLSIAFSNLIENNCKYSPDHTSLIQISYWEDNAVLRFSDSGAGISDADLEHLFTPFHRGEHPAGVEGHGIGMALAHKIISLHGGSISVRTHIGEGTTFVVRLPHL